MLVLSSSCIRIFPEFIQTRLGPWTMNLWDLWNSSLQVICPSSHPVNSTKALTRLEALGQCIPPPTHVLQVIRITNKIEPFVHWPIANLPWKFHANPFGSFCAKLPTDKQTDRQWRLHILLGGGNNKNKHSLIWTIYEKIAICLNVDSSAKGDTLHSDSNSTMHYRIVRLLPRKPRCCIV